MIRTVLAGVAFIGGLGLAPAVTDPGPPTPPVFYCSRVVHSDGSMAPCLPPTITAPATGGGGRDKP